MGGECVNKSVGNEVGDIIPPCATNINVRNKTIYCVSTGSQKS